MDDLQAALDVAPLAPAGVVLANDYAFRRPLLWQDGEPLDGDMVERWAHLDRERVASRVVVVLRPAPAAPAAP